MSRMEKVNSLLREQLGLIISEVVEMPLDSLITIKEVQTSPDLRTAKVFVSVFPFSQRHKGIRVLQKRIVLIQKALNRKISLKYIPKISFYLDITEEKVSRIEKLLDEKNDAE